MRHVDITNQRFGCLTAVKRVFDYVSPKGYVIQKWLFRCDCGKEVIKCKNLVVRGECHSCGCEKSKRIIEFNKRTKKKHGKLNTRLCKIWSSMKTRCFNKNDISYKWYGGRGISICDEWMNDFLSFYDWSMSNGYKDNLTIDRIDVNGNYEPSNCRWVDMKTQNRNKRSNLFIEYDGEYKCLSEWAEIYGFNPKLVRHKILKDKEYLKCLIAK